MMITTDPQELIRKPTRYMSSITVYTRIIDSLQITSLRNDLHKKAGQVHRRVTRGQNLRFLHRSEVMCLYYMCQQIGVVAWSAEFDDVIDTHPLLQLFY